MYLRFDKPTLTAYTLCLLADLIEGVCLCLGRLHLRPAR